MTNFIFFFHLVYKYFIAFNMLMWLLNVLINLKQVKKLVEHRLGLKSEKEKKNNYNKICLIISNLLFLFFLYSF